MSLEAPVARSEPKTAEVVVRAHPLGAYDAAASRRHGAVDPLTGSPAGKRPDAAQCSVLRAAFFRRAGYQRGDPDLDARPGLRVDTGDPQPGAGRGLASCHRRSTRRRRSRISPALARRADIPSSAAARSNASRRAIRHPSGRGRSSRMTAAKASLFPSSRRGCSISWRCRTSCNSTNAALVMPSPQALMASRRTLPMATCSISLSTRKTNTRTDAYGGSVAGRLRLLFEVVEAVKGVWGGDRVGVRLSPLGTFNDIGDTDPETTFGTIAEQLSSQDLAYLHLVNPATADLDQGREPICACHPCFDAREISRHAHARLFVTDSAEGWLREGSGRIGRKFLANPDLPRRCVSNPATPMTRPLITGEARRAIRTIRRLSRSGAKHRNPALTSLALMAQRTGDLERVFRARLSKALSRPTPDWALGGRYLPAPGVAASFVSVRPPLPKTSKHLR